MLNKRQINIARAHAHKFFSLITILSMALAFFQPWPGSTRVVQAAVSLSISPLTWNVIGLDSNNVNVGPNNFPVGARVCNTGATPATNLEATFIWDSSNSNINLRPGSLNPIALPSLAGGTLSSPSCFDFYFEVSITRTSAAYNTTRRYRISVTSTEFGVMTTPAPREIYVEHLISQNRNSINDVKLNNVSVPAGGTMPLQIGNIYDIELDGATATQGYNQLEDFINFPNTIFQILSVSSHYSADSSLFVANSSDKLYSDACLWDSNASSPTYRSCIGSDGKVGGTISTTYTVKIIGGAGSTQSLGTLIYDFSGSSYHYNGDYGTSARLVSVSSPLALTKSFSPVSITPGGSSTLSIAIKNNSSSAVTGVSITDTLPVSPAQMSVAAVPAPAASADCLSPSFSPSGGAASITYTGGVAANGTCTISVAVTAAVSGTYANSISQLLINNANTGLTATANLTVAAQQTGTGFCSSGVTLADWTVPSTAVNPPDSAGGLATTRNANVAIAAVAAHVPASTGIKNNSGHVDTYSWDTYGYKTAGQYIEFTLDTSKFKNISMSFWVANPGAGNGPSSLVLAYNNGSGLTDIQTIASPATGFTQHTQNFTGLTNPSGNTTFRLTATGANNDNATGNLLFDDIIFSGTQVTGCTAVTSAPTLGKAFLTSPIALNTTSTLRFTLGNSNTSQFTGVVFKDALPTGLTVASGAAAVCSGTLTTTAPRDISFSGGVVAASGSCTIDVPVTGAVAGNYTNTSGYISSIESGTTTNYATADLKVLAPPVIAESFTSNLIYVGNTSTLTFTITNPNPGTALTGLAFSDSFPANLAVASAPAASQCGGSVMYAAGSLTLSGGTLAAGATCTVTVPTTSALAGSYANPSGTISSTNAGTGNSASATLGVQTVHPAIAILKQVATSSNGPWAAMVYVGPEDKIYYRLTIENIGDVPLSPVSVTDPTLDISSCNWPSALAVGTASVDPTATCVVGPLTPVNGSNSNTATAHGTYGSTVYDSAPKTATYASTALVLAKSAAEGSFSAAGDTLHYSYLVTNTGAAKLAAPVVVNDSNTGVVCPNVNTVGNNDNYLDQNESITCTGSYAVTAFDLSVGAVTNTAYAIVDSVYSNTDRKTVYRNLPELVVSKSNNKNGYATTGASFNWMLTVTNLGAMQASFSSGQTLLSDQLPAGPTYGSITVGNITNVTNSAIISCAIDGSRLLKCTANGGSVTIGASTGSFTVILQVTPSSSGSLVNTVNVDPNEYIDESNEGDNSGSNSVNVSEAPDLSVSKTHSGKLDRGGTGSYAIVVSNSALAGPTTGTVTLSDLLPTGMTLNSAPSGAGWSCNGLPNDSSFDCTRSDVLLPGSSYPTIAVSVNISPSIAASVTNTATASGGGNPSSASGSDTATINNLPEAAADSNAGLEGGSAVSGNVMLNDTLGDLPTSVTGASQGVNPVTLESPFTTAGGGSLTLHADGSYAYTPPALGSVPPAGLDETFNYTITDNDGDTSSSTLTIHVNNQNLLPVANSDTNTAEEGGSAVTGSVMTNDSLGDTPTVVTYAAQGPTAIPLGSAFPLDSGGSLTLNANGSYTYTPPAQGAVPPSGLTEVILYTISDVDGDTASNVLVITVNNYNLLPDASPDTNTALSGGSAVPGNVISNDILGDTPTLVVSARQGAREISIGVPFTTDNNGTLTLNGDGSYTYNPPTGEVVETFDYTIADSDEESSSSTLTIGVTSTLIPVAKSDTNTGIEGGGTVLGNVMDNDTPGDNPTVVTVVKQGAASIPFGASTPTLNGGSITISSTGAYAYVPPALGNVPPGGLVELFSYTITDVDGDTSTSTLTITVSDTNLLPVAVNDANTAAEGGPAVNGNILSNDFLGDTPTIISTLKQGSLDIAFGVEFATSAGGKLTLDDTGHYTYTPPPQGSVPPGGLTETFDYTIMDATEDSSSAALTISVADNNLLPAAVNDANTAAEGGPAVTGNILSNDTLGDAPTTISTLKQGNLDITLGVEFVTAAGGKLTLDGTGHYAYTPPPQGSVPSGGLTETFDYTTMDATQDVSSATLTITVNDNNLLPVAVDDSNTAVEGGPAVSGNILSNDSLGDTPATITSLKQGTVGIALGVEFATSAGGKLTLNPDGSYSYSPPPQGNVPSAGLTESFDYIILDSNEDSSSAKLTINVTHNQPKALSADLAVSKSDGVTTVKAGDITTYTIQVTNAGPDPVTGAKLTDAAGNGLTLLNSACLSAAGNRCSGSVDITALTGDGLVLPTLAPGESFEISVRARIDAASGSVVNNTVVVPPAGITDPDSSNNSAADTDGVTPAQHFNYLPAIFAQQPPVTQNWQLGLGFEDLSMVSGKNDFDYNDWNVGINGSVTYSPDPAKQMQRLDFSFVPRARGAAYEHSFQIVIPGNTFSSTGTATLTLYDGNHKVISVQKTQFAYGVDNTYVIFPKTSEALPGAAVNVYEGKPAVSPQRYADLSFVFDNPFAFVVDESSFSLPHGQGLFFDPYLVVADTGEQIHRNDLRLLSLPSTSWLWPEEGVRIDRAYPLVSFIPSKPPSFSFPANWWTQPNKCVYDGKVCGTP